MKNFILFLLAIIFYKIIGIDNKERENYNDKNYIEDEEFVYSQVEESKKIDNKKTEKLEKMKFSNKNKYEEQRKLKLKENLENKLLENQNIFETYPNLELNLDDLIKISNKISIEKTEIPKLWEYFLGLNTPNLFDYFKLKKYDERLIRLEAEKNKKANVQNSKGINDISRENACKHGREDNNNYYHNKNINNHQKKVENKNMNKELDKNNCKLNINLNDEMGKEGNKSEGIFNYFNFDNNIYKFFEINLNKILILILEENTFYILFLHSLSVFMYLIPYKLCDYPKLNLSILTVFLFLNYLIMDNFYYNKYYFFSFISYFLMILSIEKFWNNLFSIENDWEIEENMTHQNSFFDAFNFDSKEKFIRKLILALLVLTFSIYISFTKFRSFYFYIFHFYIYRLIRLIMIRYFKYNSVTPCEMQPFENFIDTILGCLCLILSSWYYYTTSFENQELIGLIIVYNIIAFYYITSLDKFLYIYRNGLSDIYFEYSLYNEKSLYEDKNENNSDDVDGSHLNDENNNVNNQENNENNNYSLHNNNKNANASVNESINESCNDIKITSTTEPKSSLDKHNNNSNSNNNTKDAKENTSSSNFESKQSKDSPTLNNNNENFTSNNNNTKENKSNNNKKQNKSTSKNSYKKNKKKEKENLRNNNNYENYNDQQVKNSEESSDDEILTLENLRKFESFQELVDKINLKRYYRIDIFNVGNIIDIVTITLIILILIFSFFTESIFLLVLGLYLINLFFKHNAIYVSTKHSRIISNLTQLVLMLCIYNVNFQSFEHLNYISLKGVEIFGKKILLKNLLKFFLLCLSFKSLFINTDFLAYFNLYYYSSYKYIQQEGVNYKKINEGSELMFRLKEVYNIKSILEEILNFNLEKSKNYINYIFENCKFLGKKSDFEILEFSLEKNTKNFNLMFLLLDYSSVYFCYWLTYFIFKDNNNNILFYILFHSFKLALVIKLFFILFEYSKSIQQKYLILVLNTICFNRILGFFGDFYFDYYIFSALALLNKAVYIYYWRNSIFVNCFLSFLALLEYRRYGNLLAFLLIFSLLISKSFLQISGRLSKKIKAIIFASIFGLVSAYIFMQVDFYLVSLADRMQENIFKNFKIDWVGIFERIYFNCFQIVNKITDINAKYNAYNRFENRGLNSCKNTVFVEAYLIRELLKYLIKLKLLM